MGWESEYKDTGCDYAKKEKYLGTCLPSKEFPNGCPFTICLEIIYEKDCNLNPKKERDNKIRELRKQGFSTYKIARVLHICELTVRHVLDGVPYPKQKKKVKA
jgi:hypothetical protein